MRSDSEIKRDVETELRWTPDLDATDIAVAVRDGVVQLTGFVCGYGQKYLAERAAKRVAGVRGLANDIEVRLPVIDQWPDPDIARDAVSALTVQLPYTSETIKVLVGERLGDARRRGRVELRARERREGGSQHPRVAWSAPGVVRVENRITIAP